MNGHNGKPDDEEIMLAFSVEPEHGPTTLQRYLSRYPHLASELLDLAIELRLDSGEQVGSQSISPEVDSAWELFVSKTEANKQISERDANEITASLVLPAMRDIGLPPSILRAIRSGLVKAEGFPLRWLTRISRVGGYAADTLRSYIARPPTLSSSMSFKSDGKPTIAEKVTFRELVESTTLSQAEKAEILKED